MQLSAWLGIAVPARIPAAVVAKLNEAITARWRLWVNTGKSLS